MNYYDLIKHATVQIKSKMKNEAVSGSGFVFTFRTAKKNVPCIITAKYVVENAENVKFYLRYNIENENQFVSVPIVCSDTWFHLKEDLSCCLLKPIAKKFLKITGHQLYCLTFSEKNLLTEAEMQNIEPLSAVLMAGYPLGISSTYLNYPIMQKGYLASAPKDNAENGCGYADISVISGSSGSPLLSADSSQKLIGILTESVSESPASQENIGIYLPANLITNFKQFVC